MKSNHQARHLLGLNYKLSRQKKVVLEGDEETTINHIHATGRKRAVVNFSLSDDKQHRPVARMVFFYGN